MDKIGLFLSEDRIKKELLLELNIPVEQDVIQICKVPNGYYFSYNIDERPDYCIEKKDAKNILNIKN